MAFRFIAANAQPDHDSIATFRRRFLVQIEALFVQVLVLAQQMKCLKLGVIALDGTKVLANASKHKALSWAHANKIEAQLRQEVQQLLKLAEDSDNRAVNDGLDVPAEIARRDQRLVAIAQAKVRIEARASERHAVEQHGFEARCAQRAAQREAGKKPRGPEPQAPSNAPRDRDQVNLTDEQSRIMATSGGGFEQCYNAQAAVDTQTMLVVGQAQWTRAVGLPQGRAHPTAHAVEQPHRGVAAPSVAACRLKATGSNSGAAPTRRLLGRE